MEDQITASPADARVDELLNELAGLDLSDVQRAVVRMITYGLPRSQILAALGLVEETAADALRPLAAVEMPNLRVVGGSLHLTVDVTRIDTLLDSFTAGWMHNIETGLTALDLTDVADIGRRAGEQAAAAAAWRTRLGETVDTERVVQLLGGISRQALDSRKRTGSLFALPGAGTSHYPAWQFSVDDNTATVRPVVLRIVTEFREQLDNVSPFTIAAWATSPQPELDDRTPADWIINEGDDGAVVLAARRTAYLEAQ